MQYNGGKTRIASKLAPIVNSNRGKRLVWEPFCGGLGMTEHLRPDVASDAHAGLIALYNKLREDPHYLEDFECSETDYAIAKTLPDEHPGKAFIGFGCSFGGKWFGGYARGASSARPGGYAGVAARGLLRKLAAAHKTKFEVLSFFDESPAAGLLIYADPPYANTVGYSAVGAFNSPLFYQRCLEWAAAGSVVYISEYDCPVGSLVFEHTGKGSLGAGVQGAKTRTERLYQLGGL